MEEHIKFTQHQEHIKFIQLLYSCEANKRLCFSSVDDAMAILLVTCELLFQECLQGCMQYLNVVRWSPARNQNSFFEATHPSSPVAVTCRSVLVKEFSVNIELIKCERVASHRINNACATLLYLVEVIQHCDTELFETLLKMFSDDASLRSALNCIGHRKIHVKDILDVFNRFLKALGDGEIITPTSFRVSFLTNWVETMVKLVYGRLEGDRILEALERGIINVAETLPLVDKRRIYQILEEAFRDNSSARGIALDWWGNTLHDAIVSGKII
jgi:hypothetical protein